MREELADCVGAPRMERGALILHVVDLGVAVHFGGRCLVELCIRAVELDRIKEPYRTHRIHFGSEDWLLPRCADKRLCREVIDFVRLNNFYKMRERVLIHQISIADCYIITNTKLFHAPVIWRAQTSCHAVDLVPFLEEESGEVGTILSCDPSDESFECDGKRISDRVYTFTMKSLIQRLLERWFPTLAREIRFRAIRRVPLSNLIHHRLFEPELKLIPSLLQDPEGLCLDIGAHVGEYCYVMEQCVHTSQIYAFEPNPETCTLLRRFFPKIHIENVALSDTQGTAKLSIPIKGQKKYATRGTLERTESGDEVIEVPLTTLDSIAATWREPISFLKIDVEGHERKVIAGGKKTILRDHPIMLIEIEERHSTQPIAETFKEIEALGYRGFFLNLRAWEFSPVASFDVQAMQNVEMIKSVEYINNFLFVPVNNADLLLTRLSVLLARNPQDRRDVPPRLDHR